MTHRLAETKHAHVWSGARTVTLAFAIAIGLWADARTASAEWFSASRLPISYRTWKLESDSLETRVSQLHAPVLTSFRFSEQVDLVLSTAYASSSRETDVSQAPTVEADLASVSDLKAQIFVRLANDRLLLQAGTNAPSGAHGLDLEEFTVVQSLSHPVLGFRLKHYGEGWNTSGGLAAALPLGESARLGIGAGFMHRGEYEFVEGQADFRPGAEISASTGIDFVDAADHAWLRVDATYRAFGADELGGDEVYEEGDQIEIDSMLESAPHTWQGRLEARFVSKQDDEALAPEGDVVAATKLAAGSSTRIGGELTYRTEGGIAMGAAGSWSDFSGADQIADGTAFGAGPVFAMPLGSRGQLSAHLLYLTGTIDEETELDLSGLEVGVGLSWIPGW